MSGDASGRQLAPARVTGGSNHLSPDFLGDEITNIVPLPRFDQIQESRRELDEISSGTGGKQIVEYRPLC